MPYVDESEIYDMIKGSDHCPVSVTINMKKLNNGIT